MPAAPPYLLGASASISLRCPKISSIPKGHWARVIPSGCIDSCWFPQETVWDAEFDGLDEWYFGRRDRSDPCFCSWDQRTWSWGPLLHGDHLCCTSGISLSASLSDRAKRSSTNYKDSTNVFWSSPLMTPWTYINQALRMHEFRTKAVQHYLEASGCWICVENEDSSSGIFQ